MKRLLFFVISLSLLISLCFLLTSCYYFIGDDGKFEGCMHIDINGDGICDDCGEDVSKPDELDGNSDSDSLQ